MKDAKLDTSLYDRDFYAWIYQQVDLLREGKFTQLDLSNLMEELEDMGKSQKQALESNFNVVLMHLLKWKIQPDKRSNSWRSTIREHRRRISKQLKDSPSLKRLLVDNFVENYNDAREDAAYETELPIDLFPWECPFSLEQVLDLDFLP